MPAARPDPTRPARPRPRLPRTGRALRALLLAGAGLAGLPLLATGCEQGPRLAPAELAALRDALALPGQDLQAPLHTWVGEALPLPGCTLAPASWDLGTGLDPQWRVAGALLRPEAPTGAGLVVAHGHFEGGKSTPEAQLVAQRACERGAVVVIVDTPGVEEWDVPGRRIHFEAGAHGRALLAAGGSSAMALQVAALRRGLSVLEAEGARRIGATGASGGAVQAWYLALADERVQAAVLASAPPIPRERRPSGCACDQVPGWPGPDARVLGATDTPMLWLSEVDAPRPEGLPRRVRYQVVPGDHGYPEPMQALALAWLSDALDLREAPLDDPSQHPIAALRSPGPEAQPDSPGIADLPLAPTARWSPRPLEHAPYELDCMGAGPVVLLAGGGSAEVAALQAAGLQACTVRVPLDEADENEAIGQGGTVVDRLAGALARAGQVRGAVGVLGVRAWALPAAGSGLPFVVQDFPASPDQVDPDRDPAWIHVPGGWWGANEAVLAPALARDVDPAVLAAALARRAGLPAAEGAP